MGHATDQDSDCLKYYKVKVIQVMALPAHPSEERWDVPEAVASAVLKDLVPVLEDEGGQEAEKVVENVAERHPEGVDEETYYPGGLDETLNFVLYSTV